MNKKRLLLTKMKKMLILFIACLLYVVYADAQHAEIEGVVKDAISLNGLPLATITIKVKGKADIVKISDGQGKFTLPAIPGTILEVSYSGYKTKQLAIGTDGSPITIFLQNAEAILSDVVIIGYGKEKRADLTSSVSSLSAKDINELPATNLASALASRIPGVEVHSTGYKPGSGNTINIRGINSISQGDGPLYVIDGVALTGDIRSLNPDDIESVDVLKDAAAAGIYGSRASEGVIIITTKKGKAEQATVNFSAYYGSEIPYASYKMLNGTDYAQMRRLAEFDSDPVTFPLGTSDAKIFNKYELQSIANGKSYDWQKAVTRSSAPMQNYSISIANGIGKSKVYFSGNYLNQEGILINTGYKKYNGFLSIESTLKPNLVLGGTVTVTHDFTQNTNTSVFQQSLTQSPLMPTYDSAHIPLVITDNSTGVVTIINPLTSALYSVNNTTTNSIRSNLYIQYTPVKDLLLRSSVGVSLLNGENNTYNPRNTGAGYSTNGQAEIYNTKSTDVLWENTATYNLVTKNHNLNLLGGFTFESHENISSDLQGTQFPTDLLTFKNMGSAGIKTQDNSNYDGWSVRSLLARVIYKYKSRYILNLTARQDGSSRFGPDNRFGFFPSGSVAWRVIDEPFIGYRFHAVVSDFKLRLSYGIIGNQNLPYDAIYTRYNSAQYPFNGSSVTSGYQVGGTIGNTSLEWERQYQFNAGTDIAFLNNRIQLSVDVYNKDISSLLMPFPMAPSSGFSSMQINVAAMNTKGMDAVLKLTPVQTKNFTWQTSLNWSTYQSKITKLLPGRDSVSLSLRVGLPPAGTIVNYVYNGLYQAGDDFTLNPNGKPGDIKIKDVSGDGKITPLDEIVVGSNIPKGWGGFWNYFNYKNIALTILTSYEYGQQINNLTYTNLTYYDAGSGKTANVTQAGGNYWTPTNTNTNIPRPNSFGTPLKTLPGGPSQGSSYSVQNGDYIRIKDISLSYDIPSKLLLKAKLRSLNIYCQAIEPFLITKFIGLAPDMNNTQDYYPRYRTFLVGVKLGL
jgi:TonB-linked SusC/RagA family outer membrane protein